MGGQADRIKDREVRQGLVLGEKESSASGPATGSLDTLSRSFSSWLALSLGTMS